jgi:uncharacterized protein YodC (DUF2158 family)
VAAFHFEGDHVDAAVEVIVAEAPALHGVDGLVFCKWHLANIIGNNRSGFKEAA